MSILKNKKLYFVIIVLTAFAIMTTGILRDRVAEDFCVFAGEESFDDGSLIVMNAVSDVTVTGDAVYEARLFGVIPIKTVSANVISSRELVAAGSPFGVKLYTDGVLVVGLGDVETAEGIVSPAREAGIETGDVVLSVNGQNVMTNEDISRLVNDSEQEMEFEILRKDKSFKVKVKPAFTDAGNKIGMWVRDSTAGIGTVTFVDKQTGMFGGLGHGICDIDTGEIMPLLHGSVVTAQVNGVIKGKAGSPGELTGIINEKEEIGTILKNTQTGVYGTLSDLGVIDTSRLYETCSRSGVKTGKATIICDVGDGTKEYAVEIEKVYNGTSKTKNMSIRVTDKELLSKTGGIVQGMSGSPIIQNGKLIGAVTHVLVNDSSKGYAIFIENMLDATA
ncbi:MAG: SpoIVB peptidase [Clostridia bacterium]|nr:SpoIVB peptidase [Clostridia bacterium]